jgi:prepilin-type N-terminal cleavage/methylation domain-containing protein
MRYVHPLEELKSSSASYFQRGFTLLEIAIVMVILGLLIAPVANMYHQYRIEKDLTENKVDITQIDNVIGGYRATYGRYPCPAATNVGPGNVLYGFEFANDCTASAPAAGSCSNGVCTYHNATSGKDVLVGSLPHKTLNLREKHSFDSYHNRYLYAVTLDLTSNVSFDMSGGGISIVDANDTNLSLVTPAGSAHFIVLSHGKNGFGATSRAGVSGLACTGGSAIEQENCDNDAVFVANRYNADNFDDFTTYFTSIEPSEWQYSADTTDAIHLKNTDSFAVGDIGTDLTGLAQITVKDTTLGTGSILASGNLRSDLLCKAGSIGAADCFEPELIGGSLVPNMGSPARMEVGATGGLSCYNSGTSQDYYMVGISNNSILCTNEIYMACPSGKIVVSIDSDGNVKCDDPPLPWCSDQNVTTTCGNNGAVQSTWSGDYDVVYSGECRNFANYYDGAYFATQIAAMASFNEVQPLIDTINAEARVIGDCGTNYDDPDTQVRDVWQCISGNWSKIRHHERINIGTNFPVDVGLTATGSWWSENNHITWADAANNDNYHDCWCREDFRRILYNCGTGYTGWGVRIQKHPCPQTGHTWQTIYDTNLMCQCTPQIVPVERSCASYYDSLAGTSGTSTSDLAGTVYMTFNTTCDSNGNVVMPTDPTTVDTSSCSCNPKQPLYNPSSCPSGFTNSWTSPRGLETGVEALSVAQWSCPTGGVSDGYGNIIPHPGDYGPYTPYTGFIPACTCNSSLTETRHEDCPSELQGSGKDYTVHWDCTLNGGSGGWEDESLWTLDNNDCKICKWKAPTGAASTETLGFGVDVNTVCACDLPPAEFCNSIVGENNYKVWSNCQCTVQLE